MTALVWKELRENFKWALIAMLVLAGAECFALYATREGYSEIYFYDGITLCKEGFLTVTTFGCAAAGLMLGLVQILPELKRDRWAALLHRPISRGTVFWGKATAGMLLYFGATVPPFLLIVWLVATPGNFGVPFVPAMVQPGIADICAGIPYYFAGLLLALQHGKVARVLPLFAAVYVTYFILFAPVFRVALEAVAAMAIVLAIAGWGAIQNQESPRRRPFLGWLAFLIVIFYGACGLGELGKSLVNIVSPPGSDTYARYEPLKNGTPIRITYSDDGVVVGVDNVDGSPITDPKLKPDRIRNEINYLDTITSYIGNSHGWKPDYSWRTYRESSTYLYSFSSYYQPRLEQWFYLLEKRSLTGYSPARKEVVGKLGADGFQPASATVPGFAADVDLSSAGETTGIIQGPDFIRFANFVKRQIVDVPLPVPGPIYGVGREWAYAEDGNPVSFNAVAFKNGIALYDDKPALLGMLPYHRDVDRWGQISVGTNGKMDRFFMWYKPSRWIDRAERDAMPQYVDEMDLAGAVIKSYTLAPLPPSKDFRLRSFIGEAMQSAAFFGGEFVYWKIGAVLGSERLGERLEGALKGLAQTRDVPMAIAAISLVLAGIAAAWALRAGMPWRQSLAWAAFVLLFNIAGFIAFRLCAGWPRSIACPACRRSRRLDSEHCTHCGAGWPRPKPTDTEIFDHAATPQLATAE